MRIVVFGELEIGESFFYGGELYQKKSIAGAIGMRGADDRQFEVTAEVEPYLSAEDSEKA